MELVTDPRIWLFIVFEHFGKQPVDGLERLSRYSRIILHNSGDVVANHRHVKFIVHLHDVRQHVQERRRVLDREGVRCCGVSDELVRVVCAVGAG